MVGGKKIVGSDPLLPIPSNLLALFCSLHLRIFIWYWPNCINWCYTSHSNCNSTRSGWGGAAVVHLRLNPIVNVRALDTDQ